MTAPTPSPRQMDLCLERRALFQVSDAAGVQMACQSGSLWITLDGDPRDILLDAGDRYTATEHRRALIYALEPSTVRLAMAPAAAPARRNGLNRAVASPLISFQLQPA